MTHVYGYARVSTTEQDTALQHDALNQAGCVRLFTDHASGNSTAALSSTSSCRPCFPATLSSCGAWTGSGAA